jgi:hypothetical protein
MKTIEIDKEDEARLIEILAQNGFSKYSDRIKLARSFWMGENLPIVKFTNEPVVYWSGDSQYTVETGKMIPFNCGEAIPAYGLDGKRINL